MRDKYNLNEPGGDEDDEGAENASATNQETVIPGMGLGFGHRDSGPGFARRPVPFGPPTVHTAERAVESGERRSRWE